MRFHSARGAAARRIARRFGGALAVVVVVAALGSSQAAAFGTIEGSLGQHSEHERITRLALQCGSVAGGPDVQPPDCFQPVSLDNLAGQSRSFGAVGAPDDIPMHLNRDRDYWHCDNADWVDARTHGLPGPYPQERRTALDKLRACVEWGRDKLYDGGEDAWSFPTATPQTGAVAEARTLIKASGRVDDSNPGVGRFSPDCTYNGVLSRRVKCNVLEPFGYVLHMAEDFYSHTNWADLQDPTKALSLTNPIGLGKREIARFLDLRAQWTAPEAVPADFTSSCYPKKECAGRVIHGESSKDLGLNKDKGLIDTTTGAVREPTTPRGQIVVDGVSNFSRAVTLATREARRQWSVFRAELARRYGLADAAKMICALVLDRSETCDTRNVVVSINYDPTAEGYQLAPGEDGSARRSPVEAAAAALIDRLGKSDRVAVITSDSATGEQDVDPFVAPAQAQIDDPREGDPAPDPSVVDDGRPRKGADPTVTPEPEPFVAEPSPEGDYTHGSEEGAQENEETDASQAAPPAPALAPDSAPVVGDDGEDRAGDGDRLSADDAVRDEPTTAAARLTEPAPAARFVAAAFAAQERGIASTTAAALRSVDGLLGNADLPRGQQGAVLITDRVGDVAALVARVRALGEAGAVVSLAIFGRESAPAPVIAAVEATGGAVLATRSARELQRFAAVADRAGLTRLGEVFPEQGTPLGGGAPGVLGVTGSGHDEHDVGTLARRAQLTVRTLDGPLRIRVTDHVTQTTVRVTATRRRPAKVALRPDGDYGVEVAGRSGRRYEAAVRALKAPRR
ncbi:hypothetical protein [Conexibacter sp. CPCC 206217]|uniref:hypothetical protein n=1 Tax=Conexibacter sp. CPCC 206217 TaxID=3064574 RepID=UPI00272020EA|nr:hypothetical protein [Conexibacter sp. CPCC 206217]MDO8211140.1 hypothetical protein [Conexibacter sp. CPCC 206217]